MSDTSSTAAGPKAPRGASDIRADHWVLRLAPAAARPYLRLGRLDRPIGTWLLLFPGWWAIAPGDAAARSEEHTSELQSLMRISYAVFCLKKNKKLNLNSIRTRTQS